MTIILGLESSCDETAAALVTAEGQILAHRLATQEEAHRPYGGVVPEIAARAHLEHLPRLITQVMQQAGLEYRQLAFKLERSRPRHFRSNLESRKNLDEARVRNPGLDRVHLEALAFLHEDVARAFRR